MEVYRCKYKKLKLMNNTTSEVFHVLLCCTKTGLIEEGEIKLESPPHTQDILEVKKQVEKQFSIPVCVQTVSYNGYTLKNGIKLSDLRVRNGDMFHVEYLAKGDCTDLMKIISWLNELSNAMASGSSDLNDIAEVGVQQHLLINLRTFFSWDDPTSKSYVNKLFFADSGGVGTILKVYELLLQKAWDQMSQLYKYLERWIIGSLWYFSQTVPLCRLLIQHNIIPMLTQSLLRGRLEEGKRIEDFDSSGDRYQQSLLVQTIHNCIGLFLK